MEMAGLFTNVVWGPIALELCPRCLGYNCTRWSFVLW